MNKKNIEAIYPLSPMQQGMLFHSLISAEDGSGAYHEQLSATLKGDIDLNAFEAAWRFVIKRHPILRTSFVWKKIEKPMQVVHKEVSVTLEQIDWRHLSTEEQAAELERFLISDRLTRFNLVKPPLIRLYMLRLEDDRYQFVWSHHHILLDGWSFPLLLKEIFTTYEMLKAGKQPTLPESPPFKNYITWLDKKGKKRDEAEGFWQAYLAGFSAPTPLGIERAQALPKRFKEAEVTVSREISDQLKRLGQQNGITLSTLVQAAWGILLSRYSRESDVLFGATVSGRPAELPGVETMLGLFINTLPVRIQVDPEATLLEWLKGLQANQTELQAYEHLSLIDIQGWSAVPRDESLFHTLFVFENYPVDDELLNDNSPGGFLVENVESFEETNYPLNLIAAERGELILKLAYDQSRFDASTIERALGHLDNLLNQVAAEPTRQLKTLTLLTATEREQLITTWNETTTAHHIETCTHYRFEEVVEAYPDLVAIRAEGEAEGLTFTELNARANQIAHFLRQQGIGPESIVGIYVDRSFEMISGVFGILKAGAAYLPLDANYPSERIRFMLEDTKTPLILTQERLLPKLSAMGTEGEPPTHIPNMICFDRDSSLFEKQPTDNPIRLNNPSHLAYIIYTSGSTGKPKGVLIEHRGLINFTYYIQETLNMGPSDRHLQFFSFGFDGSVFDIFATLLAGATLALPSKETILSPPDLYRFIQAEKISHLIMTPTMLTEMPSEGLENLEVIMGAGEAFTTDIIHKWMSGNRQLFNGYGPTETTIGSHFYHIKSPTEAEGHIPIGKPIYNSLSYVVDDRGEPVPIDVPGELIIGGVGVSRGYLNREELTQSKFIPNRFVDNPNARMYRTGDLVRYRSDGYIDYLGRIDHQVKLRGYRIELGEIEAILKQHPTIQNGTVVLHNGGNRPQLIAYVVADAGETLDLQAIKAHIKQGLPDYMVPAHFIQLDALPKLPNGKINHRYLREMDLSETEMLIADHNPPQTPQEELMANLWARVLGVERVGRDENFFELGGHSILVMRLISRVREAFQVEIPIKDLFENQTVADLVARIEVLAAEEEENTVPPLEPAPSDSLLPLSYAQKRLWFIDQFEPGNLFFNLPIGVRLTGHVDRDALETGLNRLVARHQALRTTFQMTEDGHPYQEVLPELTLPLDFVELHQATDEQIKAELLSTVQQPFNLSTGPLLRAKLIQTGPEAFVIAMTIHHIISDGWSMGIFVNELAALYQAEVAQSDITLTPLGIQYGDYAAWQQSWLSGEVLENELSYWEEKLADVPPLLDLPTDRPRPAAQTSNGAHYSFEFPAELVAAVNKLSRKVGVTQFMTLLAGFEVVLQRYSGQEQFCIGTPMANRTRPELEKLIGFFVNSLIMKADLSGDLNVGKLLTRVRQTALEAYAHQDVPFEMIVEKVRPQRDLSHTPIFQVMFVLNNTPAPAVELDKLTFEPLEIDGGASQFDLTLALTETDENLLGYVEYNTDLFDEATIARLVGNYQAILQSMAADLKQPISKLNLLTGPEKELMLGKWNETAVPFPDNVAVHQLFEEKAAAQPEHPALIFEGETVTYADLNRRANRLAHRLIKAGVTADTIIGVSTERSIETIVSILGILKAGGAYLPLDPAYPAERIRYMITDSGLKLLLTQAHLADSGYLPQLDGVENIPIDREWAAISSTESDQNPPNRATADNLAYMIYTSGSTGRPKGAMLGHRGLINLNDVQRRNFKIRPESRVLQFSSLSFDASVWEIFMALRNGATLVLAPQATLAGVDSLHALLQTEQITNVTMPPSLLAVLPTEGLEHLETVIAAGEVCPKELVEKWAPGRDFFNGFGPTEATVCISMQLCDENDPLPPAVGKANDNVTLYILDPHMQPLPIGVPGELHAGGVGLAKGYHNRPELTAERFVPNPFSTDPDAKLYKTGDLCRFRADGTVEFMGRIDNQVKLRGFRIELGEIEAAIRQHPNVHDAVVVINAEVADNKRLIAYLQSADGTEIENDLIRTHLRDRLPEYMIPPVTITLDAYPHLPNGKIDRNALAAQSVSREVLTVEYVAPRDELETELAALCAGLLQIEQVGIHDNFFELGGHSLLATQLMARIGSRYEVDLPLRTLFETPSIAPLAEAIREAQAEVSNEAELSDMLSFINEMSDEEALAFLNNNTLQQEGAQSE